MQEKICISSGDPDRSTSVIRGSRLNALARMRASEILREARASSASLSEDIGTARDGGLFMEFFGLNGRELLITVSPIGSWTYFSAAIDGSQVKGGILRDDGIKTPIRWVAGLQNDLVGPGVIVG
ncbi:MAG TPA: hypothetical protein VGK52_14865 [Polyangia bacterium]